MAVRHCCRARGDLVIDPGLAAVLALRVYPGNYYAADEVRAALKTA